MSAFLSVQAAQIGPRVRLFMNAGETACSGSQRILLVGRRQQPATRRPYDLGADARVIRLDDLVFKGLPGRLNSNRENNRKRRC